MGFIEGQAIRILLGSRKGEEHRIHSINDVTPGESCLCGRYCAQEIEIRFFAKATGETIVLNYCAAEIRGI